MVEEDGGWFGVEAYAEALRFPFVEISGVPVPRLILGHLPFLGESYQGTQRNREYSERFSDARKTVGILCRVVREYGITVVAATPATEGRLSALFLDAVKDAIHRTSVEIALVPCLRIPITIDGEPLDDYRRWLTYYHIEKDLAGKKIVKRYVEDPILLCRRKWRERFLHALAHLRPYLEEDITRLEIDYERLEQAIQSLQAFRVLFAEPGSETDFLAMTDRLDLLSELVDWLRTRFGYRVLLGSHHAGSTIPILEESQVRFDGYITPINRLGIMMFPTRDMALKAIRESSRPTIAIKPLAGGRINITDALEYVYEDSRIDACMIGVASEAEAEEDLTVALKLLSGLKGEDLQEET